MEKEAHAAPRNDSSDHDGSSAVKRLMLILARYPDFKASLLELLEKQGLHPKESREIISKNPRCFVLETEIVRARLQLDFCPSHCGLEGCQKLGSCNKLHICPRYVHKLCSEKQCFLGHTWRTNHNNIVFMQIHIDTLPVAIIHMLVKSTTRPPQLNICRKYNKKQCHNPHCDELHICAKSILEASNPHKKCQLNHSLMTQQSQFLFRIHGIATNDSLKDVIASLVSTSPDSSADSKPVTPPQGQKCDKVKENENSIGAPSIEQKVPKKASPVDTSPTSSADSSPVKPAATNEPEMTKQLNDVQLDDPKGVVKDASSDETCEKEPVKTKDYSSYKTCWSVDVLGNVGIHEICYNSVESLCAKEATGCPRLHSPEHFHWQISDLVSPNWYNLPILHAKCLEISYCDPAQDNVALPRLDPSTQSPPIDGLLCMLGRDVWTADFQKLELTNSSQNKKLQLRRLCTEPVADLNIMARNHIWYFLDNSNAWIPYGNNIGKPYAESLSAKIEKHFSQKLHKKIKVVVNHQTYILDFLTMRQTNKETNKVRDVRRRPGHLEEEKNTSSLFPHTWKSMILEQQMVQILLSTSSSEYQKIAALIQKPLATKGLKILRIRRIQNPQLWRNFQRAKKSLKADSRFSSVEDLRVFKKTRSSIKGSVCSSNFDWKDHEATTEMKYGQGVHFYIDPSVACNNIEDYRVSFRYLFVVRVLVASKTMSPILQPLLKVDTIVDNTSNPSVIVKCDKNQYYPEYLVTVHSVI